MTIEETIASRGISEVVHFTTNKGLVGILDSRSVRSRDRVSADQRLEFILQHNAGFRKDTSWTDYISLSITRINGNFFAASTRWHDDLWWAILSFTPAILSQPDVCFATTNNIYPAVQRGTGAAGLDALFADVVVGRYGQRNVRDPGFPRNHTTCVQAEVLYPGEISTDFLQRIYVRTEDHADSVAGMIAAALHEDVEVVVAPERFR